MKKKTVRNIVIIGIVATAAAAWKPVMDYFNKPSETETEAESERVKPLGPKFNPDSAYAFTQAQCDFGPRVMNSEAHERCGAWLEATFKRFGCEVKTQKAALKGFDGTTLNATNIIASYKPEATQRVMLCAHWDSRPWADADPDSANWRKPIDAANDGASGVAVMLEIARILNSDKTLGIGVDFVCFDAEDWGTPQWADEPDDPASWALGAQHFAANLPQGFAPRYGILLDMVGGTGAQFYREMMSMQYAPDVVKAVWRAARHAGYGSFFPNQDGGGVTDDHIPMNEIARIPTIDIIPFYPGYAGSSFGPTWHTLADNMDNIDKQTLQAVGQTVVQALFETK